MAEQLIEVIDNFSLGMMEGVPLTDYPAASCTYLKNVEIRNGRYIANRRGFKKYTEDLIRVNTIVQVIDGFAQFKMGATEELIVCAGGKIYTYDTDTGAYTDTTETYTSGTQCHFKKFYDSIIMYNGVDAPQRYNGTTWTALASAPIGNFMEAFNGNLFAGDNTLADEVKWSDDYDPETWTATNFDRVSNSQFDQDKMTALRGVRDDVGALVFSRNDSWTMTGLTVRDYRFLPLANGRGCVAQETLQVKNGIPIWLDYDGFYTIDESQKPIRFYQLDSIFETIDMTRISKAWSAVFNPGAERFSQYVCGITLGTGNSKNTHIFVYDFVSGGWRVDTNLPADIFEVGLDDNNNDILLAADNETGWIYQLYTGTDDEKSPISSSYISHPIAFKDTLGKVYSNISKSIDSITIWYRSKYPVTLKVLVTSDYIGSTRPSTGIPYKIVLDGEQDAPLQYELDTAGEPNHFLRLKYAQWKKIDVNMEGTYFQVKIDCIDSIQDWCIFQIVARGNITGITLPQQSIQV